MRYMYNTQTKQDIKHTEQANYLTNHTKIKTNCKNKTCSTQKLQITEQGALGCLSFRTGMVTFTARQLSPHILVPPIRQTQHKAAKRLRRNSTKICTCKSKDLAYLHNKRYMYMLILLHEIITWIEIYNTSLQFLHSLFGTISLHPCTWNTEGYTVALSALLAKEGCMKRELHNTVVLSFTCKRRM